MVTRIVLALVLVGCGTPVAADGGIDATTTDASVRDGGPDAAPVREAGADAAITLDAADDAAIALDAFVGADASVLSDAFVAADAAVVPDAFVAADAFVAPDAFVSSDAGPTCVDIQVSNTCGMSVSPTSFSVPHGMQAMFCWRNRSHDYPVDVWMSYGGGYTDLAMGATWYEPVRHCLGPTAHDEYADISTACSSFRFLIHCL